ncbi:Hypothetical protein MIP_00183 [Mycobacterium intracellulare subsp. intracellulare MTCC 9506]|uniref:Uncharacterized protein n=1 Tax=Mycobacterium indicus pranii (strain DSM 45239 / MTCC 9506) TaxID=1232724 RepID=J9W7T6_MYCIP|nr:Hypothetical protein MIP_00183 [Mycobacterium intracellulare subsp. intracellulare MTCC 9506]
MLLNCSVAGLWPSRVINSGGGIGRENADGAELVAESSRCAIPRWSPI